MEDSLDNSSEPGKHGHRHLSKEGRCEHAWGRQAIAANLNVQRMLNEAGLRSTQEREAVLLYMIRTRGPSTVEELFDGLKHHVNKVTLYRTLERFADTGLVERVRTNDRARRYEFQHEHHHHITCTRCGLRVQIVMPERELLRAINKASNSFHAITSHTLEFYGVCVDCAQDH